jgi:hypothetical protein
MPMLGRGHDDGATGLTVARNVPNRLVFSTAYEVIWSSSWGTPVSVFFMFSDCHESRESYRSGWVALGASAAGSAAPIGILEAVEGLMAKAKTDGNGGLENTEPDLPSAVLPSAVSAEAPEESSEDRSDVVATVATVAVVGIGAVAFEAALLPGIVLGVAAMWLPRYFPKMGEALNPLFRSTVRGAYKLGHKTREMMAEAQEQFHDIAAEVHAEGDGGVEAKSAAPN